jgi:hypothetical protein
VSRRHRGRLRNQQMKRSECDGAARRALVHPVGHAAVDPVGAGRRTSKVCGDDPIDGSTAFVHDAGGVHQHLRINDDGPGRQDSHPL